jgi:rRNA-processing protein FCF1
VLLVAGKINDEAAKFFDSMQWDPELTTVKNAIPRIGEPSWAQSMSSALVKYSDWTASAIRRIRGFVADSSIYNQPRNEMYWVIMSSDPGSPRTHSMLYTEMQELSVFFMECANQLRAQRDRFRNYGDRCLILDTNDLLHYQRFDQIPWITLYGKSACVVIPHVVVDEIDSKSYGEGGKFVRRARGVYRVLESYLGEIDGNGFAILRDGSKLCLLADDPGHHRLPNNDNEIVAQAAVLHQAIAPRTVTVITRDIGMRARAGMRELPAEKLSDKYLIPEDGLAATDLDAAVTSIEVPEPSRVGEAADHNQSSSAVVKGY